MSFMFKRKKAKTPPAEGLNDFPRVSHRLQQCFSKMKDIANQEDSFDHFEEFMKEFDEILAMVRMLEPSNAGVFTQTRSVFDQCCHTLVSYYDSTTDLQSKTLLKPMYPYKETIDALQPEYEQFQVELPTLLLKKKSQQNTVKIIFSLVVFGLAICMYIYDNM